MPPPAIPGQPPPSPQGRARGLRMRPPLPAQAAPAAHLNARGYWSPLPDDRHVNDLVPISRRDTRVQLVPPEGVETRYPMQAVAWTLRWFGHQLGVNRFNDSHGVIGVRLSAPRPGMAAWDGPRRTRYRTPPGAWEGPPLGIDVEVG